MRKYLIIYVLWSLVTAYATFQAVNWAIDNQKKNDYFRCMSVIGGAISTGKLPKTTNKNLMCKYHLK